MILSITQGRLIDPYAHIDEPADLLIEKGKVLCLFCGPSRVADREAFLARRGESARQTIDASGLVIAPGLIDGHSHFRDPGQTDKETLASGASAAARGGYTTVVLMANTCPPVDCPAVIDDILARARELPLHILQAATVSRGRKGRDLVAMEEMRDHGAALFSDDGSAVMDADLLRQAMERAHALHTLISLHEEDPAYIGSPGINRGKVSRRLGLSGAAFQAEASLICRDIGIAAKTGGRIDFQHLSSAASLSPIAAAKKAGVDVWAEVTPHHLALTEDAVLTWGSLAKVNPPLRTESDRLALIRGLVDGTIDVIASDHAPHTKEEKNRPFAKAPSGMIGLETALSLCIRYLVEPGYLSLSDLLARMTTRPAAMYGLSGGRLTVGSDADLVLFDPAERYVAKAEDLASKSRNSPFIGHELPGKVKYTICGGKIIYRDKELPPAEAASLSEG